MTTAHYATAYQSPEYCAAFRHGVLTIVRFKDGASCTLSVLETNRFRVLVMDYELSADEREPFTRACALCSRYFKKRKWVAATMGGSIITFYNEPVRAEA